MKKIIIFTVLAVMLLVAASCDFLAPQDMNNIFDPESDSYDPENLIPPGLISGLEFNSTFDRITVSWSSPGDSDLEGYLAVRSTGSISWAPTAGIIYEAGDEVSAGVTVVFSGTSGSFSDDDLDPEDSETVIYYSIFAYDDLHNYSSGYQGQITVPDIKDPGAVETFNVRAFSTRVELSWTGTHDSDLEGYVVVKSTGEISWEPQTWKDYSTGATPDEGITVIYAGADTTYTDSDVTIGSTYYYEIFSFDEMYNYSSGETGNVTIPATGTPDVPGSFSALYDSGAVELSWSITGLNNIAGVLVVKSESAISWVPTDGTVYTVDDSVEAGVTVIYKGSGISHSDTSINSETTYYYRIFAYNDTDTYSEESDTQVDVPDIDPPGTPLGLSITSDVDSIDLDWDTPGDTDVAGYLVVRTTSDLALTWIPVRGTGYAVNDTAGEGVVVYNDAVSTFSDTTAVKGLDYNYYVFTRDEIPNYSDAADDTEKIVWSVSYTVVSPEDGGSTYDTLPLIDWLDVSDSVSYRIKYSNNSGTVDDAEAFTSTDDDSYYQVTIDLTVGDTIYWKICAVNSGGGMSEWSTPAYSFAVDELAPMVFITGGTFEMGDIWTSGSSDERPTHDVTISDFYIGKYEVTYEEWDLIKSWAEGNGYTFNVGNGIAGDSGIGGGDTIDEPVTTVSWRDAIVWCNAASQYMGWEPVYYYDGSVITDATNATACDNTLCFFNNNGYRLPTEAEWEYAAKAGADDAGDPNYGIYTGSSSVTDVGYTAANSGDDTHPVGELLVSDYGVYDMMGNTSEWCWDWYYVDYYGISPDENPEGPASGTNRIARGGHCKDSCRAADRYDAAPATTSWFYGFRLARSTEDTDYTVVPMVDITAGTFTMGDVWDLEADDGDNELPTHSVTLSSDFRIGKYEVTYEAWERVKIWAVDNNYTFEAGNGIAGNDGTGGGDTENEPVTTVSWRDTIVWCNAASEYDDRTPVYTDGINVIRDSTDANGAVCDAAECDWTGDGYRLPTEAEWEYTARAGATASDPMFGKYGEETVLGNVAWYSDNSDSDTHPVGEKLESDYGTHDMIGNVWEWCWDWYGSYTGDSVTDPTGESSGPFRVLRGGSWSNSEGSCRVAYRGWFYPGNEYGNSGFRLALSPSSP